jgi:hypothetical protein
VGVSVLPWLGGYAVGVAWIGLSDGEAVGKTVRELAGGGFGWLPVVMFVLVLAGTFLAETGRFEGWFRSRFAVGFGLMMLALFTPMALGAILDGEFGFALASMFVMFTGYPLFAFAAGSLLHWRSHST